MEFKYTTETVKAMQDLRKAGIAIQTAGVKAINSAVLQFQINYRLELTRGLYRIRNKNFTLNAIAVINAKATGKGGELKPLDNIYATVGVKNMSNGQEHYLAKLEEGKDKQGMSELNGSVAIPLDTARQSKSRDKAVATQMRLKQAKIDGVIDLTNYASSPKQQYAIIQSMAKRNKFAINNRQTSGAQYYIADFGEKKWLYKIIKNKAVPVRDLSKDVVKIKEKPLFEKTTQMINEADMSQYFISAANELIK